MTLLKTENMGQNSQVANARSYFSAGEAKPEVSATETYSISLLSESCHDSSLHLPA